MATRSFKSILFPSTIFHTNSSKVEARSIMADRLTISPTAAVPIIGGGPAGMSCALWLHNYGLRPIIIEQEPALGGMARRSPYPNDWLLGRPDETARDSARAFASHIRKLAIKTWLGVRPQRLHREGSGFRLEVALADGVDMQSIAAPVLVVATGTRFRGEEWLDAVKEARKLAAAGRVHLGPTAVGEPEADVGSQVAVIGGGDKAFDVSRMLAEKGVKVTVVMRSQLPKARLHLVERLRPYQASGMARVLAGRTVTALADDRGTVRLRLDDGGAIAADRVVLLFGYQPNTDLPWLGELALATDARGYVVIDNNTETSCRGIFAVGDLSNSAQPCIATALASGTMAARQIQTLIGRAATPVARSPWGLGRLT
jgi:thioredoxin reductase